jgi:hypothetical protein
MRGIRVNGERVDRVPAPETSPFFLIVKIQIRRGSESDFEEQMPDLRETFGENGFNLLLAGLCEPERRRATPFAIHLWHMPSADQLLKGMATLADNVAYTRIDDLIIDEEQELGTPARQYGNFEKEVLKPWQERRARQMAGGRRRDRYLLVTEKVEPRDLAEYGALYEERLTDFNASTGWQLGEGLLHITGPLNRISRAWIVPHSLTRKEAVAALAVAPGASCISRRDTEVSFMHETRYEVKFGTITPREISP